MDPIDRIWSIARDNIGVDAEALFAAVIDPAVLATDDPRTQLLVRDSVAGLKHFWGIPRFASRISSLPQRTAIESFDRDQPADIGFPSLRTRIMNVTDPTALMQLCRDLGRRLRDPVTITIGGSMALMVQSLIARHTEDIDVVDELPSAIRENYPLQEELLSRYRLKLAHFQSHYLPDRWETRTWSLGVFDELTVRVIDPIDILVGKLFSRRIAEDTAAFRSDAKSLEAAKHNWYILTGEKPLP